MDLHSALFASSLAAKACAESGGASGSGSAQNSRVRAAGSQLEARLDRALMTVEAMWVLMKDKLEVTDEELVEMIIEIDLSDGQIDGRARHPAQKCSACDRAVAAKFIQCIYCGEPITHQPFA